VLKRGREKASGLFVPKNRRFLKREEQQRRGGGGVIRKIPASPFLGTKRKREETSYKTKYRASEGSTEERRRTTEYKFGGNPQKKKDQKISCF